MAGRIAKSLLVRCVEGSFCARRHHRLLAEEADLPWPRLAELQRRYRQAAGEWERRELGRELERRLRQPGRVGEALPPRRESLSAAIAGLGVSEEERLLAFFPHFLVHKKGLRAGQPFTLEPFQTEFVREFARRDEHGQRVYRIGLLGLPRGNGKTTLAAGLGLHELCARSDSPEVYCLAAGSKQAAIVLNFARSLAAQGELTRFLSLEQHTIHCPSTRGLMLALSGEGRLHHGRMPSAALIDELWTFRRTREREGYVALLTALHKRPDSFLLITTTAGPKRTGTLWQIYQQAMRLNDRWQPHPCLTAARDEKTGFLCWWYGAPDQADPDDETLWHACNPASWLSPDDLRRQRQDPGLTRQDFQQLILNQWPPAARHSRAQRT